MTRRLDQRQIARIESMITLDADANPAETIRPPAIAHAQTIDSAQFIEGLERQHTGPQTDDGRFTKLGALGQGGMGVVYRAQQSALGRDVAIKATRYTYNDKLTEGFLAESLVTAHLEHPNIVPVHDLIVTEEGHLELAMKLIDGTSWQAMLDRPSSLEETLERVLTASNAIAFAHSKHIAHCDIKPENIMIGAFGEVIVVDWGLATDFGEAPGASTVAVHRSLRLTPAGTPAFMAPEQVLADTDLIGPGTDIYLLGATLFYTLTGRLLHTGKTPMAVLFEAALNDPPAFHPEDDIPDGLERIILRCLETNPRHRFPSVEALQNALRAFLKHRQSDLLTKRTLAALKHCTSAAESLRTDPNALYADFADTVAGFRQARVLWPDNAEATKAELRARLAFAEAALDRDALEIAASQLSEVPPETQGPLKHRLDAAFKARARTRRSVFLLRTALYLAAVFIVGGAVVSTVLVLEEKQIADENHALAQQRLEDIQRLADVKTLSELELDAEALWPPLPDKIPGLEDWITRANALVDRQPQHRDSLATLRARATPHPKDPDKLTFEHREDAWEYETLLALIERLDEFPTLDIVDIQSRLAFAKSIEQRSLTEYKGAWDEAIADIKDPKTSPQYKGLELTPQIGLVPIGKDPQSGLWEFVHLQTGAIPKRDRKGRLTISAGMGLVLVLIPGGRFDMGALPPSRDRKRGEPNTDPDAQAIEAPIHSVELSPFFLSKYEMTQGQWQRSTGENPSVSLPGKAIGDQSTTLLHPVEHIEWERAHSILSRLHMDLPTEAQWEYAARAGTVTVYWTGNDPDSLEGALNIADRSARKLGAPASWPFDEDLEDGFKLHAPIGQYRANGWGLHDMLGNVREWCLDRYGAYTLATREGTGERLTKDGAPRVFRGGGFKSNVHHARSADRYSLFGDTRQSHDLGLRPARRIDP